MLLQNSDSQKPFLISQTIIFKWFLNQSVLIPSFYVFLCLSFKTQISID